MGEQPISRDSKVAKSRYKARHYPNEGERTQLQHFLTYATNEKMTRTQV